MSSLFQFIDMVLSDSIECESENNVYDGHFVFFSCEANFMNNDGPNLTKILNECFGISYMHRLQFPRLTLLVLGVEYSITDLDNGRCRSGTESRMK